MNFHAGFDTDQFPGLAQLQWLRSNTNLEWCGYYLAPAPSHADRSWMGKRAALVAQGWGLLPIFLGQQTIGPGSHHVSGAQGSTDGLAAVQLMHDEGFPACSYVFIDWEDGSALSAGSKDYLAAWAAAVNAAGYQPGIYCSHGLAGAMAAILAGVQPPCDGRIWAWKVGRTDTHAYTCAPDGFPCADPALCGYDAAIAWQCEQNCVLSLPGAPSETMPADLSTSSLADPSAAA
ncbi:glycoside hydrolase domain-containing protein [Burkholderia glumae]|uniref:DUF1906 domain-containing protein n=1 Tax=Burkholderia glumae TaxID=337 RepID=A0AAQ0BRG2_BURGL|nr:glycoside hydrolase domain-containing protein [Burkholderia glumae]ACR32012.1 Hypothetical protein bglu_2g16720 [Burkholderia glumae BGR1]AJY63252.1 hypothetical protein KS03_4263 [Burkholderia glumae LMG 2196 = ATCC 33617]KHJ60475.1 hypothetical protein NCPPB3923_23880 [Burkholderia glumae]MCM2484813.1 DUF1906 domain-containing protein [Burkholderia glumae]MCM2510506.1 DUF1906 domain-containing protein [Burkholderia glumae]